MVLPTAPALHRTVWAGFLMLGLGLALPSPSQARLGETETAITKRFGDSLATLPAPANLPKKLQNRLVSKIYAVGGKKDGALVEITFLEGISASEFYFLEGEKAKTPERLNETQIQMILEANAGNSSWESLGGSAWRRQDGSARAQIRETTPSVSLNPNIPLQTQLLVWSGLEIKSKDWDDFLTSAQRELDHLRKQQEAEARRKSEQEAAARDLLRGI